MKLREGMMRSARAWAAALALVVAGCGSPADDDRSTSAPGSTAEPAEEPATAQPADTDTANAPLDPELVAQGEALFESSNCTTCHTVTGQTKIGPTMQGYWGSEIELESGETTTGDAENIRRSLMQPSSEIVAGFRPMMPSYEGQLSEGEIQAIIEYIRSLE